MPGEQRSTGRHDLGRLLPEIATALIVAALIVAGDTTAWLAPWLILLLPVLMRTALMGSVALHGLGHALAAGPVGVGRFVDYVRALPPCGLLPFGPLFIPGLSHPTRAPRFTLDGLSPTRRRRIALAGPAASLVALCAATATLAALGPSSGPSQWVLLLLVSANAWILLTSWTDYATLISGAGRAVFCGNFGILSKRDPGERGFLPPRFRRLTERLGQATDVRGQQAGGIAVLGAKGRFVGRKIVNGKRGDLTRDLLRAFRRRAAGQRLIGRKPLREIFHLVGHYRYGTSSCPAEIETHWHRWARPRTAPVWSVDGQDLVCRRRVIENLITHNGDFDAWIAPWGRVSNPALGQWLTEVLGKSNAARGDSPKIAGMLDLLLTQGRWDASLRLGYALLTGRALPRQDLAALTAIFDEVFTRWAVGLDVAHRDDGARPLVVGCASLAEVFARNAEATRRLVDALRQASLSVTRDWPDDAKKFRQRIVGRAVHAFFHNDLYTATMLFMERAEGTFGLVTTTSLQPGAVALAAERQPLFIGADPETGMLIYASEAAALTVACGPNPDGAPLPYRYDLSDGDLVLLQVREDTADNTITRMNRHRHEAPTIERITARSLDESARAEEPHVWIAVSDNPYLETRPTPPGRDRVLDEMTDIPSVLERIRRDWSDPASLNRRTARAFSTRFLDSASHWAEQQQGQAVPSVHSELDLLVLGVENNLYVGERFIEDLRRIFPYLNAGAVDSVRYCDDPQRHDVGPTTITLAISHSGQTFNTLDAVRFIQALHAAGKAGPVFVMTGEADTLMGAAVGQVVKADAPWVERVLITSAGWRSAEPATVSAAATHATLTQLLLRLARDVLTRSNETVRPFGFAVRNDDLEKLEALDQLTVRRAEAIFGRTTEGWDVETEERAGLKGEGRYLASLLTEPALVFIATAVHLFVMLWLGWNPVLGGDALLRSTLGWSVLDLGSPIGEMILAGLQTAYFLFAAVLFTLILRVLQRRPLWDRVFVGRTLVIGEEPYVKNLLAQYVSKLFSLAYEFAGFVGIHAADSRSGELLHLYGHRITRGLVLFLGLPDGRWPGRERAEAAVCMTSSQARGVRNMGGGALVVGVGHNAVSAAKVDRFVRLGACDHPLGDMPRVLRGGWSELARDLQESRFAAFERLMAGYVIFHTAAASTRNLMNALVPLANLLWTPVFWTVRLLTLGRVRPSFGYWDLARTQSGTRIATTAAPVPAITQNPRDYLTAKERNAAVQTHRLRRLGVVPYASESFAAPVETGTQRHSSAPGSRFAT
ncbi:zinc metalloprotease [Thiocapsa bogorovii]|uniref:hypothetical protein n=1 Tax=Thiocapsa bogorovii TaxID=521689 RepID=UPI001E495BC5|nr:hypothetical protein [Thiocapsa bogorovii]UHD14494.1 hypothetical protein LT988_14405 [Thiocapsa bogorovii]